MPADEIEGTVRPLRQLDTVHSRFSVLEQAQVVLVAVDQHFGTAVELGDQFLHVAHAIATPLPRVAHVEKNAIGHIEATALKVDVETSEWLLTNQIMEDDTCRRIMAAIHELRDIFIVEIRIALAEFTQAPRIECTDGLGQITVRLSIMQIQGFGVHRCEHPRHDRILRNVIVRPSSETIQAHQVFVVRHVTSPPLLCP